MSNKGPPTAWPPLYFTTGQCPVMVLNVSDPQKVDVLCKWGFPLICSHAGFYPCGFCRIFLSSKVIAQPGIEKQTPCNLIWVMKLSCVSRNHILIGFEITHEYGLNDWKVRWDLMCFSKCLLLKSHMQTNKSRLSCLFVYFFKRLLLAWIHLLVFVLSFPSSIYCNCVYLLQME